MDVLKPWLAPTIEGELGEALRHWQDGTSRHQSGGRSRGLAYDDGSNLRVPSAKKGPFLQITKFLTFEEPIQVTLSDSVIRVNASIANQASQRYAEKEKRRLTEGTLGDLLQLREFEIVATHIGPRNKRLTLYVQDFSILGLGGAGDFGVAPQAIESRDGAKELLNKLTELRRSSPDARSKQVADATPIRSQPSSQASEAENDQESQVDFATQVPRSRTPFIGKPKPSKPTTGINISSTSIANSAKSLAPPTRVNYGKPLADTLSSFQLQAAPARPGVSGNQNLLDILRSHMGVEPSPGIISEPTVEQVPGPTAASIRPAVVAGEKKTSQDISLAPGDDNASKAPLETRKRKRQSLDIIPRKTAADDLDLHGIDKGPESLAVDHDLDKKTRSGAAATDASIHTLRSRPATPSILGSPGTHPGAPLEPLVCSVSKLTSSASSQNIGRNRISSREVKIPKDQEALLNRADSWLPAEPGQHEPTANIPISLLKTLNQKAHLLAQRPTKTRKQIDGTVISSTVLDETADSDSDVPLSSGQWPASSPERGRLPSDSSCHSGSATPTVPKASTSVSRGLKSWSERDEGSGREFADSWADSESDSVEVSASMLPSVDRGPRTPREKEGVNRRSSTNSVPKSLPPYAQPALVQSAGTDVDETLVTKEAFSPPLSASPTPESDLEMTVPLALNEKADSVASSAPMQHIPSTASQPQDPFTQVKRTPYINGPVQKKYLSGSETVSSPLKANFNPLTSGTINDDTDFVSASVLSVPKSSTAETHGGNRSSRTIEDRSLSQIATRLAKERNGQEVTNSILDKPVDLDTDSQREIRKAEAAPDTPNKSSLSMSQDSSQILGSNQLSMVAEANARTQTIPESLTTLQSNETSNLPHQFPTSDHAVKITHEMKRKVADSSFGSPSMTKRQKRFKVPSTFTFTERSEIPRDPSAGAWQYRQDFLASRRSSDSSTSTMSPTIPFTILAVTTPEDSRDPLERARQTRQEFMASRRSSETSTSTTSPRVHSTAGSALSGTIQAEGQNAEEKKNVGMVTVQKQSADIETEHQKMTEVEALLARSQDMGLDAPPRLNGIASTKPDSEDAKSSTQDNLFFEYGSDSLFVAQNVNVEDSNAEQSMVIKPSSYVSKDEAQRAQFVELDVAFQSPGHQEAENGFANANDHVNRIVNSAMDLMVVSNDQLPNNNEDDQPVDPNPDKGREDSPTRADEVAEQGSNAPTLGVILGQVAEPETVVFEPLHQQQSIGESVDTQMPDKPASEPTRQEQPVIIYADTPMPDKIAAEHTSQQRSIDVDTNIPMPEVQVNPDITPLSPIAMTGEPMNPTTPKSFPVKTFVADPGRESQPRPSPAALETAIPLSNSMSGFEVESIEEHQDVAQRPIEITQQESPVPQSIYGKFKATYPAYPGDLKHFVVMCRKISQLVEANRMEHQSLWDDFIVRHKIDYSQYLRRCAEEAENGVPYEEFYQTDIEEPQYQKRVINRRNLDEALALVVQKTSVPQTHMGPIEDDELRVESMEHKSTSESDAVNEKMHDDTPASDDVLLNSVGTKPASKVATSHEIIRKPSESRITIDLTANDPPDDESKRTKGIEVPLQPSVPQLVRGVSIEPSRLQYRSDNPGSLYQVPYTSPAMRDSYVPPPSHSMRSPPVPATASAKSMTKSLRRSLPWKELDHSAFKSSPKASASATPEQYSHSGLREIRDTGDARFQVLARSTPTGVKQSQNFRNTCHTVIQSNWGIQAHELLEPEYYHGQVLSETMIELLAEISSKVKIGEARNRIKEAIDTRIRESARRGAGHPTQDRKILKSDLEVVRGVVKTSSMSTASPFSPPHTNAKVEKQKEGTPPEWWEDTNSPFKSFARAYASIRRGHGNSFAQDDSTEPGDTEKVHEAVSGGVQLRKIDFMSWNL